MHKQMDICQQRGSDEWRPLPPLYYSALGLEERLVKSESENEMIKENFVSMLFLISEAVCLQNERTSAVNFLETVDAEKHQHMKEFAKEMALSIGQSPPAGSQDT